MVRGLGGNAGSFGSHFTLRGKGRRRFSAVRNKFRKMHRRIDVRTVGKEFTAFPKLSFAPATASLSSSIRPARNNNSLGSLRERNNNHPLSPYYSLLRKKYIYILFFFSFFPVFPSQLPSGEICVTLRLSFTDEIKIILYLVLSLSFSGKWWNFSISASGRKKSYPSPYPFGDPRKIIFLLSFRGITLSFVLSF